MKMVTDSREVSEGALYVALKGARVDGHSFLEQVAQRGGSSAIVSTEYEGESFGLRLFRVADPLRELQRRAQERLRGVRICAITGSVGKSSVTGFVATLLDAYKTPGNQNSQVGLPLAVLNAPEEARLMALEMGMSEPGQIGRLVEIAPPEVALITGVSAMHAEGFESLERIVRAKEEIFSSGETRVRIAPYGLDVESSVTFSAEDRRADYFGELVGEELEVCGRRFPWQLPGRHNVANAVAALAVAREMGATWGQIEARWSQLKLPAQRFELLERSGVTIVNDTYNMGEASACAALESLPEVEGERVGFLSEMLELGSFSEAAHRAVGECARRHLDKLFVLGRGGALLAEAGGAAGWTEDLQEFERWAQEQMRPGNLLLFKGARRYALEKIVARLR